MSKLFIYPTPLDAHCKLHHDSGVEVEGVSGVDANNRPGQSFAIPSSVPNRNGCELILSADGYFDTRVRAILVIEGENAFLYADDFTLNQVPAAQQPEPPDSSGGDVTFNTPLELINAVYNSHQFNLNTKEGCGQFTEECCRQLHNTFSKGYGHIKKNPGQNQYNGHAVDAVMLLVGTSTADSGIYDIITSSESPEAKPAFNYAGPSDPNLWYYDERISKTSVRVKVIK